MNEEQKANIEDPIQNTSNMENANQNPAHGSSIKRNGISLTTILSLCLIFSVLIAGFFVYQNFQLKKIIYENTQPSSTTNPLPTPTPNPTDNWENILDERFGFTFKAPKMYPLNNYESSEFGSYDADQQAYGDEAYYQNSSGEKMKKTIHIEIRNLNITSWEANSNLLNRGEIVNLIKEDINNLKFTKFIVQRKENSKTEDRRRFTGFATSNGKTTVAIATENYAVNQEFADILMDQILSTFKFIEATASPSAKPSATSAGI